MTGRDQWDSMMAWIRDSGAEHAPLALDQLTRLEMTREALIEQTAEVNELREQVRTHREMLQSIGIVLDFASASRNGEPFEALIRARNYLPNPVARFCTVELKILRIADYMRSLGHEEFDVLVGIRADEPVRMAKLRADPSGGTRGITRRAPMAELGCTKGEVGFFWRYNGFDLALPNINGTTMHGNCDLCFLKHSAIVMSLIAEKPARAVWWAAQEQSITNSKITNGGTFRSDRPSYAQMLAFTEAQADAFGHLAAEAEDGIECIGCTD